MGDALKAWLRVDEVPPEGSIVVASVRSNSSDLNVVDNAEMEVRHEQSGTSSAENSHFLPLLRGGE